MRFGLILLPFAVSAAPVLAQPAAPLPPAVADPATVDRLADAMQSLSGALLDLPVGEMQAALEGRKANAADRHKTVRSETGLSERDVNAHIAAARPRIEQSIKALNQALPEITRNLQQAQKSVERAISNMPDPNYPRR
jgi:hypothetical protein